MERMPFRKMHPLQEMRIAGTMRLMMICMLGIASASAFHLTPGSLVQKVCYPFFYLCPGFMTPCETLQVSPLQSLQKCSTQNFLHHVYIFPLSSNHTVPYELFLSVRPSQPFSCITGNTQFFLQLYIADKFDSERSESNFRHTDNAIQSCRGVRTSASIVQVTGGGSGMESFELIFKEWDSDGMLIPNFYIFSPIKYTVVRVRARARVRHVCV